MPRFYGGARTEIATAKDKVDQEKIRCPKSAITIFKESKIKVFLQITEQIGDTWIS